MRAEDIARMTNLQVAGSEFGLTVPPALLESIARRVLELLAEEGRVQHVGPLPEYLNVEEAAEYLRCDKQRIYDLVSARRLPKHKDGTRLLIKRADLAAYLEGAR